MRSGFLLLCFLLTILCSELHAQSDTCFISDSAESFLERDDNWFALNADLVQILGTVDTVFYKYTNEIQINEANRKWLYMYLTTRRINGVIVVLDSSGRKKMIYGITGEGRTGSYYEYYQNGNIKVKGQYCEECPDVKSGMWYFYNESGDLVKVKRMIRKHCNGRTPSCS